MKPEDFDKMEFAKFMEWVHENHPDGNTTHFINKYMLYGDFSSFVINLNGLLKEYKEYLGSDNFFDEISKPVENFGCFVRVFGKIFVDRPNFF